MRSGCLTSSARDNGHGGRWWTLRRRRRRRATPAEPTEPLAEQEETRSPLTDSNRRPPPYHPLRSWRTAVSVASRGGQPGFAGEAHVDTFVDTLGFPFSKKR